MPKRTSIFQDEINAIRTLYAEGKTTEEISDELNIDAAVVVTFDPDYKPEPVKEPGLDDDDEFGDFQVATRHAAKLADDAGIDIGLITGTGKDGVITKSDVEAVIAARDAGSE